MKHLKFAILLFVISCTVHLVPPRDQNIIDEVTLASGQTNTLYSNVIQSSDKSYGTYAAQYAMIDTEINDILLKDAARPKSKVITGMMNDVNRLFSQFEADHKNHTLNNSQLLVYQDQMNQIWKNVVNAETNFK